MIPQAHVGEHRCGSGSHVSSEAQNEKPLNSEVLSFEHWSPGSSNSCSSNCPSSSSEYLSTESCSSGSFGFASSRSGSLSSEPPGSPISNAYQGLIGVYPGGERYAKNLPKRSNHGAKTSRIFARLVANWTIFVADARFCNRQNWGKRSGLHRCHGS